MADKWNAGDTVRVTEREVTAADAKSNLYYPHYGGLVGTIAKVFGDGSASVNIDLDSLPAGIRERHDAGTKATRQKWLDGLSEEGRNRLTAAEKKFSLRYTLLVSTNDLLPASAGSASAALDAPPARKSLSELDADEQRHLDEVARKRAQ